MAEPEVIAPEKEVEGSSDLITLQRNSSVILADPEYALEAMKVWIRIKDTLDKALPDCIMDIQGKPFRKKKFWRAAATAFNITLEFIEETERELETDRGWLVRYRAIAPNGRFVDADGSCFQSEKSGKMKTVHNVRGHAHTRAKNRAIADLVGFGEVSYEETNGEDTYGDEPEKKAEPKPAADSKPDPKQATGDDLGTLTAMCIERGEQLTGLADCRKLAADIATAARGRCGCDDSGIPANKVETLKKAIRSIELEDLGKQVSDY